MDKLIYIIDDDPVYLRFMREHFNSMGGMKTEVFANGDTAMEKIKTQPPYLIILDNHLQDASKDGIYYLKQIIKLRPRIPVVYITADTDPELRKKVEKVGVSGYITKDPAFLVYLRTTMDEIANPKKKGLLSKIFK